MEEIFVVGVGMTPFGRMLDLDIKTLTRMATERSLADAGLGLTDVKAAGHSA
jgi:acetyl-CoA acetyltransferase